MQNYPWDQTFVGWIHITSAAVIVGGLVFWAVARSVEGAAEWERAALARFRPFFWSAALLLLLTGGYTWSVRMKQGYPGFYNHVVLTKILLYVVLFGIAGVLTKPRDTPSKMQQRGSPWLPVCVVVCLVILFLSAFLRRVKPVEATPAPLAARSAAIHVKPWAFSGSSVALHGPGTSGATLIVSEKGHAPIWRLS